MFVEGIATGMKTSGSDVGPMDMAIHHLMWTMETMTIGLDTHRSTQDHLAWTMETIASITMVWQTGVRKHSSQRSVSLRRGHGHSLFVLLNK